MNVWMLILAALLAAPGALAQQQRPPVRQRPQPPPAVAVPDGQAGVAAVLERRTGFGCTIALALRQKTGVTRPVVIAAVEVFPSEAIAEIHNVVWQFADPETWRWTTLHTQRPCVPRPRVVIRELRLCSMAERGPHCDVELAPYRPSADASLWLDVSYRTALTRTPLDPNRLPPGGGSLERQPGDP